MKGYLRGLDRPVYAPFFRLNMLVMPEIPVGHVRKLAAYAEYSRFAFFSSMILTVLFSKASSTLGLEPRPRFLYHPKEGCNMLSAQMSSHQFHLSPSGIFIIKHP